MAARFQNSNLNLRRNERLFRRNSELVRYFSAIKCSCGADAKQLATNRASLTCTLCKGMGYAYGAGSDLLATVSSYQTKRDPLEVMSLTPGDLTLSLLPRCKTWVSDFDLFELPNYEGGEVYEGDLLLRGLGPSDQLKHPAIIVDTVSAVDVVGNRTDYVQGTDFTVAGSTLTWLAGHGPAAGTGYAVRYHALLQWIAFMPPYTRYARGTAIGQHVLLKRRELVFSAVS